MGETVGVAPQLNPLNEILLSSKFRHSNNIATGCLKENIPLPD